MRFLVDENLPIDVVGALESAGHDVVYVSWTDLRTASDESISRFAIREKRILVTRDLDFPLQGQEPLPGLVLLRLPDSFRRSSIGRVFEWFLEQSSIDDLLSHVTVVSPGRIRRGEPYA